MLKIFITTLSLMLFSASSFSDCIVVRTGVADDLSYSVVCFVDNIAVGGSGGTIVAETIATGVDLSNVGGGLSPDVINYAKEKIQNKKTQCMDASDASNRFCERTIDQRVKLDENGGMCLRVQEVLSLVGLNIELGAATLDWIVID